MSCLLCKAEQLKIHVVGVVIIVLDNQKKKVVIKKIHLTITPYLTH